MSNLSFREITREDIAAAAEMISAAFAPVSERNGLPADKSVAPLIARLEEEFRQENRKVGAWLEEQLIGYFSLVIKDEEVFEISRFCVRPDAQRNGYGQQMLNRAIAEIRGKNGVAAVCAVIADHSFVLDWLEKNRFHVEVSGNFPGISCPVCILQKDLLPVDGCNSGDCAGCSGGCH